MRLSNLQVSLGRKGPQTPHVLTRRYIRVYNWE
jgi:hypothetical protein